MRAWAFFMPRSTTSLLGLATATPPNVAAQAEIGRFVARVLSASAPPDVRDSLIRRARMIFERGGIETRATAIADFNCADPAEFRFFPKDWSLEPFPTTAARMRLYETESVALAADAAKRALDDAGLAPRAVTHLVISTCTGFFAPGPDLILIERLGLAPSVRRTTVGFMGCYAGFTTIRLADEIVRADPSAVVLTIAVEVCSLHFQKTPDTSTIVSSSLFADGASAAVYGTATHRARAEIRGTWSFVAPNTREEMSWRIGDHGFVMTLGTRVPSSLAAHALPFTDALLTRAGVRREESTGFAIHPGGRRIVDAVGAALALTPDQTASARSVLAKHGNMSSATILFVLAEELAKSTQPRTIAALGFGPGLTMEGAVFAV